MVAETNYIYLAFLLVIHYLGLTYTAYEVTIKNTTPSAQAQAFTVDFEKVNEKVNDWIVVATRNGENHRVPMTIVKNTVTDFEKGGTHTFTFEDIDFTKISTTTDTIFNKSNVAIATILNDKTKKAIVLKVLRKGPFDIIEMKYK